MFIRSLQNLKSLETGFGSEGVLLLQIDSKGGGYDSGELADLYRRLIERVEAILQVRSASSSLSKLLSGAQWITSVAVEGYTPRKDEDARIEATRITPNYFQTVGIPLLQGRAFDWTDRDGAPRVAVVNETFARRFFSDSPAVGGRFGLDGESSARDIEIVGLVRDIKYQSIRRDTPPLVYFPVTQNVGHLRSIEVRTGGDPAAVALQVRLAVTEVG